MANHKTAMPPKILRYGWIARNNFGDDLLCSVIDKIIRRDIPNSKVYYLESGIFQSEVLQTEPLIPQVVNSSCKNFLMKSFATILYMRRGFDAFVLGGGNIFESRSSIVWKLAAISIFKLVNPKARVFVCGVSISSHSADKNALLIKLLLNLVDQMLTRDIDTLTRVSNIVAKGSPKIIKGEDFAHALDLIDDFRSIANSPKKANRIFT